VIPEHEQNVLQQAECINGKILAYYLIDASDRMSVFDFSSPAKHIKDVPLPGIGTVASSFGEHDKSEFMFKFTSFTDPGSSWRIDMDTFDLTCIAETKLGDNCGSIDDFVTDQVWFTSKDGTKVPMFVVRKKTTLPNMDSVPENPILTLLYGYGGFNISLTPMFSPSRLVFLNNLNGMLCVPSLRGGGEYGEDWHKAGTKEKKQNVFDDFIAAAEYLIDKKYTDPSKLVINGGSNGGTLVTACAN
jgi:prolyl oligopeptidase